jgi:hypothetical protein
MIDTLISVPLSKKVIRKMHQALTAVQTRLVYLGKVFAGTGRAIPKVVGKLKMGRKSAHDHGFVQANFYILFSLPGHE